MFCKHLVLSGSCSTESAFMSTTDKTTNEPRELISGWARTAPSSAIVRRPTSAEEISALLDEGKRVRRHCRARLGPQLRRPRSKRWRAGRRHNWDEPHSRHRLGNRPGSFEAGRQPRSIDAGSSPSWLVCPRYSRHAPSDGGRRHWPATFTARTITSTAASRVT